MKTRRFSKAYWISAMVLMLAFAVVVSGCGGNDSATGNNNVKEGLTYLGNDVSEPVELIWYMSMAPIPQDANIVMDEVNKLVKEKINATVKLMLVPSADYVQKMNTVVAAGEAVDIMWTANWSFLFVPNVAKGVFAPLDGLLEKYAPDIFKQMPAHMREGVKVGGKTYAVPNYQATFMNPGFVVQNEYIEKYKLDVASVKKLEDMEPFFAKIAAAEKGVVPFGMGKAGVFSEILPLYNLEPILSGIAVINKDDPRKVLSWYDTKEYEQYQDLMRDWYLKGYINQNAATANSNLDLGMSGKMISQVSIGLYPGGEAESANKFGGKQVTNIPLTTSSVTTSNIQATLNAISQSSKNKERALMFLNLVNTDSKLFNLLAFGIEGKHHTINADGTVKIHPDGGYAISSGWRFGNVFNGYELDGTKGQQPNVKKMNEQSIPSPNVGFSFQGDLVTSQIANVSNVLTQYQPALNTGSIDKSEKLEEFRTKLKQAGIDDILVEMQKQLDAFHKAK